MEITSNIKDSIGLVVKGIDGLCAAFENIDEIDFYSIHADFERFEETLHRKTFLDAAFAFMAERHGAGRLVGSSRATDYLTKCLGLSRAEAAQRLSAGESLYGKVTPEPVPDPEHTDQQKPTPNPDEDLSKEEQRRRQQEAEEAAQREREKAEKEAERRAERERRAQEERRRKMAEEAASAEIAKIIEQELRNLNKHAQPGPQELRTKALEESKKRSPEDLRKWLRKQVTHANAAGNMPNGKKDPFAATRKRNLWMSEPDADGSVRLSIRTDALGAALLAKVLLPAQRPGGPELPPEEDNRSFGQRRHDQLMEVCSQYVEGKNPQSGLGSIVVSATLDDLETLSPESEFITDTGHKLTVWDLVRLSEGVSDYLAVLDSESFQPLALGRTKRTASFAQKLALFAAELCCSAPGCSRPMAETDVHHLVAWQHGGATDIRNLTLLCRRHHVDNNDHHDFRNGMGHSERDPHSGRVGKRMPGHEDLIFNESTTAEESAAAHFRRRAAQRTSREEDDGPPPTTGRPEDSLFDISTAERPVRRAS